MIASITQLTIVIKMSSRNRKRRFLIDELHVKCDPVLYKVITHDEI